MSPGKPQRQLTMLRKIHYQGWTLQALNDHQLARVAAELSKSRPTAGNLRMRCPCAEASTRDTELEDPTRRLSAVGHQQIHLICDDSNARRSLVPFPGPNKLKEDAETQNAPCTFCSIPLVEILPSAWCCCGESNL